MNLLPVQASELTIGEPLLWDLFNQSQKKILTRGEILSNADEALLKKSPLFRRQEEENTSTTEKPKPTKASTSKPEQFIFQDMGLKVGDKLQLKLPANIRGECCDANSGFCNAKLIGYVDNASILINMPQLAKLANLSLIDGDQVTVQLFSGQYAFSFTSYIDKIIKSPFHYMHLSFPNKILGQIIRKSRRIKTKITVIINNNPTRFIISNLSMTGAEILTNANLGKIGEILTLSFTVSIHGIKKELSLLAVIKSTKPLNNHTEDTFNFGVEFQALASEQSDALQSLIYQELVEHPESST